MTDQTNLLFREFSPYGIIEVWEYKAYRWLSIDKVEQSRINTERPHELVSTLHQYFLSALLFIETPKTVLLGGLGGGSLARYFNSREPKIKGSAIELNTKIVDAAINYFDFPLNTWDVKIDDIKNHLDGMYDLLILDIAEKDSTPHWLFNEEILITFKSHLSNNGILVFNLLVEDAETFTQALKAIRKVFNYKTLCSEVPGHKNVVVFAFSEPSIVYSLSELEHRIKQLNDQWGFDFTDLLEQIKINNPKNNGIFKL